MKNNRKPDEASAEQGAAQPSQDRSESADEFIEMIDDEPVNGDATEGGGATRRHWLIHRLAEAVRAVQSLSSRPASPWPIDRVPERVWRELGDQALGIAPRKQEPSPLDRLTEAWDEEERLIHERPESEREELRRWFASFHLLRDFTDNFEVQRDLWLESERERWEAAYWQRAADESFGKRPWTGPSGREG